MEKFIRLVESNAGGTFLAIDVDAISNGQSIAYNSALGQFTPASFVAGSVLTSKGDVLTMSVVGGGSPTLARLPVGTDGQVIVADSTQNLGLRWATAGAAGAGGLNTQFQYNNTGVLNGSSLLTTDGTHVFCPAIYGGSTNNTTLTLIPSTQTLTNGGQIIFGKTNTLNWYNDRTAQAVRWQFYDNAGTGGPSINFIFDSGIGGSYWGIKVGSYGSTFQGPDVYFEKARGTFAVPTAVANTDRVFGIAGVAFDGATYIDVVDILAEVDGTVTQAAALPTRLRFFTTPAASETSREVFRINNSGDFSAMLAAATGMTAGFICVPAASGTPTGVPTLTGITAGHLAMYYDTLNNKFYVYNAGWKGVTLA